ncbi:MAG: tyrosine-type recombinase/integrase [Pseudomonadota bacterium]
MPDNRISFTRSALNKLPTPPKGKRVYYYDTKTHGLALGITGAGTKTFVVYRKVQGKPERITLGRYPDIDIDEARALAHDTNASIARGENPNESKRLKRQEWTLGEFFETYLEQYSKPHKLTWAEDEAQFNRYLRNDWGKRPLSTLTRQQLQSLHIEVGELHGRYAANRLIALLRNMFNKATEWGWPYPNPAEGIRKFSEKSRERFLQADELPRFFQALEDEPNDTIRDYILLSLLTGARKSNMLEMRWEELNLETGIWRIPRTKNGSAQSLPLPAAAIELLRTREIRHGLSEFVFPGRGKTGHLVEPKTAWRKLLERADIDDLRLHDLRRSMGSWQAATGANISVIGKTLNHKDMKSTAIYARLDVEPVRIAMETAANAMLAFRQGKTAE